MGEGSWDASLHASRAENPRKSCHLPFFFPYYAHSHLLSGISILCDTMTRYQLANILCISPPKRIIYTEKHLLDEISCLRWKTKGSISIPFNCIPGTVIHFPKEVSTFSETSTMQDFRESLIIYCQFSQMTVPHMSLYFPPQLSQQDAHYPYCHMEMSRDRWDWKLFGGTILPSLIRVSQRPFLAPLLHSKLCNQELQPILIIQEQSDRTGGKTTQQFLLKTFQNDEID